MLDEFPAHSGSMHAGINEQATDEIIEKSDKADWPVLRLGDPVLRLWQINVAHEVFLFLNVAFSEKRVTHPRGGFPDVHQLIADGRIFGIVFRA